MEELEVSQKVKIIYKISSIRSEEVNCSVKWFEHDRIGMNFPENKKDLSKYLIEGKEIEVLIYTDKGIFVFDSVVIDSPFDPDFVVEIPEEKTQIQRREYVRIPVNQNIILMNADETIRARTINISGGGIRFRSSRDFRVQETWDFVLPLLRNNNTVEGSGKILYNIKHQNFSLRGVSIISVIKFTNIEEKDRNKIIKMCFEEEAGRLNFRPDQPNTKT